MTSYQEGLYIAANVLLRVCGSDSGEWWIDLVYVQGAGAEPLLLNRLPLPAGAAALGNVAALLSRAAEVAQ